MVPTNIGFWIMVGLILLGTFIILSIMASLYRKVGPNQALIVYGLGGPRVYSGQGVLVWPMVQSARELSLELMSFGVAPREELQTKDGSSVLVDAMVQTRVGRDAGSILTAAEHFLDKSLVEREELIRGIIEGHLRDIVGQFTEDAVVREVRMVGNSLVGSCVEGLRTIGVEIVSLTIKEIRPQDRTEVGEANRSAS